MNFPYYYYLLLQPLATALAFEPITPAGIGIQEGGISLLFVLLGMPIATAYAFAILARFALLLVDGWGLPLLIKALHVFPLPMNSMR